MILTADLAVGDTTCTDGGIIISIGADDGLATDGTTPAGSAGDGQLDALEVDEVRYVCNGADGTDGEDGTNGINSIIATSPAAESDCPHGGVTVKVGLDDNGDGELREEHETFHICNGEDGINGEDGTDGNAGTDGIGSVIAVSEEAAGENCAQGGQKIEAGMDDNANGVLDADEIESTVFVCNGAPGAQGTDGSAGNKGEAGNHALTTISALTADDEECSAGGVLVETGMDSNGDGILSANEVNESAKVCNGVDGLVDEDKDGVDDRIDVTGGNSCAANGGNVGFLGFFSLFLLAARRRRS